MIKLLICLLLCAQVELSQVQVFTAKTASVEPTTDAVLVFMDNPQGPVPALKVHVTSDYKSVTVRAVKIGTSRPVRVIKMSDGSHLITGTPGQYAVTVIEFDPEKGLEFTDVEGTIGESTPEPPPVDNGKLFEVAKRGAIAANDRETAKALATAYRQVVTQVTSTSDLELVRAARRQVLMFRQNTQANWQQFIQAVDPLIDVSTVEAYKQSILTLARALESI